MKNVLEYDDQRALEEYVLRNRQHFTTPFEQRAERLAILREKARYRINKTPSDAPEWAKRWLSEYESQTDAEVEAAIGSDLGSVKSFQQRISDRIEAAFREGDLSPVRCPKCRRIVMSPAARQCLWCGYDWHATA